MDAKSRWRFSLRGLLVFVLLLGAWLAFGVNRFSREKVAMTEVIKYGGRPGYRISVFYPFRYVNVVAFIKEDLGNEELRESVSHLQKLPHLSELVLIETSITDEGLVHLKKLQRLKKLNLFNNEISDEGIADLVGMENLRELDLSSTLVSDKGVLQLQTLEALRELSVSVGTPHQIPGQLPESPEKRQQREQAIAELQPAGVISQAAIARLKQKLPRCSILKRNYRHSDSEDFEHDLLPAVQSVLRNGDSG